MSKNMDLRSSAARAVFVDLSHLFYDPHGIYSIAAVLKQKNIDVHFVSTRHFRTALHRIRQLQPDLLLYSSFSTNLETYLAFDRFVKQHMSVVSLVGGPAGTYDWKRVAGSTIDYVCIGEGEIAIPVFIQNGFKPVKNIFPAGGSFPHDFFPLANLDQLPFPDRSIVYHVDSLLRDFPSKQFFSGRGCPYNCAYCFNHQFREIFRDYGPTVRKKSVDYFIAEIQDVQQRYPLKNIVFNDDTFIIDKPWFFTFADRFVRDIGVAYACNVRADLIDDQIAQALQDSGCCGVNWSIESGSESLRNGILRRHMTNDQIYRAADLLRKRNIPFRVGNMLALPGETFDQMLETVSMNIKVRPQFALANIFVPFPGLALTDYAISCGYCSREESQDLPKDYFSEISVNLPLKEKERVYKLFCLFPFFVAFPSLFTHRSLRNFLLAWPRVFLRFAYEIYYTYVFASFYTSSVSLVQKIRIGKRYIMNLLG